MLDRSLPLSVREELLRRQVPAVRVGANQCLEILESHFVLEERRRPQDAHSLPLGQLRVARRRAQGRASALQSSQVLQHQLRLGKDVKQRPARERAELDELHIVRGDT